MPKAGYCKKCDKNVWLNEDGSCENGHPPSSVTNKYESMPQKPKQSLSWLIAVLAILLLTCLPPIGVIVVWFHPTWKIRSKIIATTLSLAWLTLIVLSIVFASPTLEVSYTSPTNKTQVVIKGETSSDIKVILQKETKDIDRVRANQNGHFTFKKVHLAEGKNKFTIKAVKNENKITKKNFTIVLDTKAPSPPKITTYKKKTSISKASIKGHAERKTDVRAYRSGKKLGNVTTSSTGRFIFTKINLEKGKNKLSFKAVDKAGNISKQTQPITVEYIVKKPKKKKKAAKKKPEKKVKPIADHTSSSIKKLIEDKASGKITDIEIVEGTGLVAITYRIESVWDDNDVIFKACKTCEKIMPTIFRIPEVKIVDIQLDVEFTDEYGKDHWEKAVFIRVVKTEADKIEWNNINSINRSGIIKVSDTVYIHPAVYKNIDNEDIEEALAIHDIKKSE